MFGFSRLGQFLTDGGEKILALAVAAVRRVLCPLGRQEGITTAAVSAAMATLDGVGACAA